MYFSQLRLELCKTDESEHEREVPRNLNLDGGTRDLLVPGQDLFRAEEAGFAASSSPPDVRG